MFRQPIDRIVDYEWWWHGEIKIRASGSFVQFGSKISSDEYWTILLHIYPLHILQKTYKIKDCKPSLKEQERTVLRSSNCKKEDCIENSGIVSSLIKSSLCYYPMCFFKIKLFSVIKMLSSRRWTKSALFISYSCLKNWV